MRTVIERFAQFQALAAGASLPLSELDRSFGSSRDHQGKYE